ncbi:MAG: hypothetical protein IPI65_06265 [Bacteroidetes bacterium]|nr:hypothetical protein [Bacteroidota bacterium]
MIKGEIFFGRKSSEAYHPIVYLEDYDSGFFIGVMLTSSKRYPGNILMKPEHIRINDEKGNNFELTFNNTHFVRAKLLKRIEWEPFRKVGELSDEGIQFIEDNINSNKAILWEEYLKESEQYK